MPQPKMGHDSVIQTYVGINCLWSWSANLRNTFWTICQQNKVSNINNILFLPNFCLSVVVVVVGVVVGVVVVVVVVDVDVVDVVVIALSNVSNDCGSM